MYSPRNVVILLVLFANVLGSPRSQNLPQPPQSTPFSQQPTIRVTSNLVYVGVNVADSHGHFVSGLGVKDFEIYDSGVRQAVVQFASEREPAFIVLLIENSAIDWFMAKLHRSLTGDAGAFISKIPPQDPIAILTYSNRTEVVSTFTSDRDTTLLALGQLNKELGHGGAISGALDLSRSLADTLDWLSTTGGSKTIVLFSTGFDSTPPDAWAQSRQRIAVSDVRIFAISVFGDLRIPEKHRHLSQDERQDRVFLEEGIAMADDSLRQLALTTGGHALFPKDSKEFDAACSVVSELTRGQYTLAFVPTLLDGKLHNIEVKVRGHHFAHVEHRQAYLAAVPSS